MNTMPIGPLRTTARRLMLAQRESDGMWQLRDEDTLERVTRYALRSDAVDALTAAGFVLVLQNAIGSSWERQPAYRPEMFRDRYGRECCS